MIDAKKRANADMRASMTRRWHTLPAAAPPPTLAEHSFRMLQLLLRYYEARQLGEPRHDLVVAVARHDLHEVLTGDRPSTGRHYEHDERARAKTQTAINVTHDWMSPALTDDERHELKAADLAEAMFSAQFLGLPPDVLEIVVYNLSAEIADNSDKSPAYNWMRDAAQVSYNTLFGV